jgi:cytochrome oxidase Cu insertion factor (SCO1/SenC/PrrC family)
MPGAAKVRLIGIAVWYASPMKTFRIALACATLAAALSAQNVTPPKTTLKVGDEAPDFSLPDTTNKQVKLSDFRGKKMVVLAFFPAAFTGG